MTSNIRRQKMQDLDSYQVFCALELLKNKQRQKNVENHQKNLGSDEDEIFCACAKYLDETL